MSWRITYHSCFCHVACYRLGSSLVAIAATRSPCRRHRIATVLDERRNHGLALVPCTKSAYSDRCLRLLRGRALFDSNLVLCTVLTLQRPLLSSPSGSVSQTSGRDNGWGHPLGGGARGRGGRGRGRGGHGQQGGGRGNAHAAYGSSGSHGDDQPRGFFKESFCEDPWKRLLQRSAQA